MQISHELGALLTFLKRSLCAVEIKLVLKSGLRRQRGLKLKRIQPKLFYVHSEGLHSAAALLLLFCVGKKNCQKQQILNHQIQFSQPHSSKPEHPLCDQTGTCS